MTSPRINLTNELLLEWCYRCQERLGMICEDRHPIDWQLKLAEAEANDWITQELAFQEVDRGLAF